MNTRRMNRLEELGRVDAEKAFTKKGARNLKDEKKRIVRELKATGGKVKQDPKRKPRPKAPRDQQRKRRMDERSKPKGIRVIEVGKEDGVKLYKDGGKVKKDPMRDRMKQPLKTKGLKPVKPSQKGLKKLPTKVRNKMGYMKKGGRVGMGKALRGGGCVR